MPADPLLEAAGTRTAAASPTWQAWPRVWSPLQVAALAAAYGVCLIVSLSAFSVPARGVSALWVPSGVLVALFACTAPRQWLLLAAVCLPVHVLGNVLHGRPLSLATGFAAANLAEAVLVVLGLRRIGAGTLDRPRGLFGLVLVAALVGAAFSATIAAITTALLGGGNAGSIWLLWGSSVFLGVTLAAPLVSALLTSASPPSTASLRLEAALLAALVVAGTQALFAVPAALPTLPLLILPYPLLLWAALRQPPLITQLLTLALAGIATAHTVRGGGPMSLLTADPVAQVIWLNGYLLVGVVTTQLVAATSEARRRAADDLAARERRYAFLAQYSRDIIALVEPGGRFAYVSPACATVVGRPPGELVGRSFYDFVHPTDALEIRAQVQDLRAGVLSGPLFLRYRAEHADGRWIWLEATVAVVSEPGSPPGRLVTVTRDATERRRVEARLAQAQRSEALGQLAGGLAHDFGNILQAILGNADVLAHLLGPTPPAEVATTLREMEQAARRGIGTTRRLLTLGREAALVPERVGLDAAIDAMLMTARGALGRDLVVQREGGADSARVQLVPTEFEQLLLCVLLNARDAMGGAGTVTVRTRLRTAAARDPAWPADVGPAPWAEVQIDDTGPGVPPELRERIFEPFFSTKSAETGSGLGLATAYAVARRAQGHLWCEAAPSGGARFTVVLPVISVAD